MEAGKCSSNNKELGALLEQAKKYLKLELIYV